MRARTILAAGTAATVVAAVGGYSLATAATGPTTPTYTGCLAVAGSAKGKFAAVAAGASPTRTCTSSEKQVRLSGGDITSIAAGNGVQVTSTELGLPDGDGDVALGLAPSYRLPQACTSGQLVKRTTSSWTCAAPAPKRTAYVGYTGGTVRVVGDQYAVLGDGMDLPAGTYALTAKVNIHGEKDSGYGYAECRLDATGSQGMDVASMRINATVSLPMTLMAAVTKTVPFRVSVLCSDNGHDMSWYQLRIVATPTDDFVNTKLD